MATYSGIYISNKSSLTNCNGRFATAFQQDCVFYPAIEKLCAWCNTKHTFRFDKAMIVTTPSAQRNFLEYCKTVGIESGVETASLVKSR